MTARVLALTFALLALAGCGGGDESKAPAATMRLEGPALDPGEPLPVQLSCEFPNAKSPAFRWSSVPAGTRGFAFTVDDPDAPGGNFVHWTLWHLDARARGLSFGAPPPNARTTKNGAGRLGYTPPCPPKGDEAHHYVFAVYALDREIDLANGAPVEEVRKQIDDAALARGALTIPFSR